MFLSAFTHYLKYGLLIGCLFFKFNLVHALAPKTESFDLGHFFEQSTQVFKSLQSVDDKTESVNRQKDFLSVFSYLTLFLASKPSSIPYQMDHYEPDSVEVKLYPKGESSIRYLILPATSWSEQNVIYRNQHFVLVQPDNMPPVDTSSSVETSDVFNSMSMDKMIKIIRTGSKPYASFVWQIIKEQYLVYQQDFFRNLFQIRKLREVLSEQLLTDEFFRKNPDLSREIHLFFHNLNLTHGKSSRIVAKGRINGSEPLNFGPNESYSDRSLEYVAMCLESAAHIVEVAHDLPLHSYDIYLTDEGTEDFSILKIDDQPVIQVNTRIFKEYLTLDKLKAIFLAAYQALKKPDGNEYLRRDCTLVLWSLFESFEYHMTGVDSKNYFNSFKDMYQHALHLLDKYPGSADNPLIQAELPQILMDTLIMKIEGRMNLHNDAKTFNNLKKIMTDWLETMPDSLPSSTQSVFMIPYKLKLKQLIQTIDEVLPVLLKFKPEMGLSWSAFFSDYLTEQDLHNILNALPGHGASVEARAKKLLGLIHENPVHPKLNNEIFECTQSFLNCKAVSRYQDGYLFYISEIYSLSGDYEFASKIRKYAMHVISMNPRHTSRMNAMNHIYDWWIGLSRRIPEINHAEEFTQVLNAVKRMYVFTPISDKDSYQNPIDLLMSSEGRIHLIDPDTIPGNQTIQRLIDLNQRLNTLIEDSQPAYIMEQLQEMRLATLNEMLSEMLNFSFKSPALAVNIIRHFNFYAEFQLKRISVHPDEWLPFIRHGLELLIDTPAISKKNLAGILETTALLFNHTGNGIVSFERILDGTGDSQWSDFTFENPQAFNVLYSHFDKLMEKYYQVIDRTVSSLSHSSATDEDKQSAAVLANSLLGMGVHIYYRLGKLKEKEGLLFDSIEYYNKAEYMFDGHPSFPRGMQTYIQRLKKVYRQKDRQTHLKDSPNQILSDGRTFDFLPQIKTSKAKLMKRIQTLAKEHQMLPDFSKHWLSVLLTENPTLETYETACQFVQNIDFPSVWREEALIFLTGTLLQLKILDTENDISVSIIKMFSKNMNSKDKNLLWQNIILKAYNEFATPESVITLFTLWNIPVKNQKNPSDAEFTQILSRMSAFLALAERHSIHITHDTLISEYLSNISPIIRILSRQSLSLMQKLKSNDKPGKINSTWEGILTQINQATAIAQRWMDIIQKYPVLIRTIAGPDDENLFSPILKEIPLLCEHMQEMFQKVKVKFKNDDHIEHVIQWSEAWEDIQFRYTRLQNTGFMETFRQQYNLDPTSLISVSSEDLQSLISSLGDSLDEQKLRESIYEMESYFLIEMIQLPPIYAHNLVLEGKKLEIEKNVFMDKALLIKNIQDILNGAYLEVLPSIEDICTPEDLLRVNNPVHHAETNLLAIEVEFFQSQFNQGVIPVTESQWRLEIRNAKSKGLEYKYFKQQLKKDWITANSNIWVLSRYLADALNNASDSDTNKDIIFRAKSQNLFDRIAGAYASYREEMPELTENEKTRLFHLMEHIPRLTPEILAGVWIFEKDYRLSLEGESDTFPRVNEDELDKLYIEEIQLQKSSLIKKVEHTPERRALVLKKLKNTGLSHLTELTGIDSEDTPILHRYISGFMARTGKYPSDSDFLRFKEIYTSTHDVLSGLPNLKNFFSKPDNLYHLFSTLDRRSDTSSIYLAPSYIFREIAFQLREVYLAETAYFAPLSSLAGILSEVIIDENGLSNLHELVHHEWQFSDDTLSMNVALGEDQGEVTFTINRTPIVFTEFYSSVEYSRLLSWINVMEEEGYFINNGYQPVFNIVLTHESQQEFAAQFGRSLYHYLSLLRTDSTPAKLIKKMIQTPNTEHLLRELAIIGENMTEDQWRSIFLNLLPSHTTESALEKVIKGYTLAKAS